MSKALAFRGLESGADIFTNLARELGMCCSYTVSEVYGLDPELLSFVPQPVKAVILYFPSLGKEFRESRGLRSEYDHQNLWYLSQVEPLGDACGTIAIIHSLANTSGALLDNSVLKEFVANTSEMTASEKGDLMSCSEALHSCHSKFEEAGQTESFEVGNTPGHYICFVPKNVFFWELDGMLPGPIKHAYCGKPFLDQCAEVIRSEFMAVQPDNINFVVLALCSSQ